MLSVGAGCLPHGPKVVLNAAVLLLILPLELQPTEPCNYLPRINLVFITPHFMSCFSIVLN